MKDAKALHPLARNGTKGGQIKFIDTQGTQRTFTSLINDMTGDRLSYFDNESPSINDKLKWVRSVFDDIRRESKLIVSCVGDF